MGDLMSGSGAVLVVVAIMLVMLVGGTILKQRATAAGARAGQRFAERVAVSQQAQLATAVLLAADGAVAAELIHDAVATMRLVTRTGPATWDLEAIEKSDLTFGVSQVPGGSQLAVHRYREQLGNPAGAPYWKDVLKKVRALAAARGVATSTAAVQHVRMRRIDDKNWEWGVARG